MTMEELKVYCEVPDNVDLRLMERTDESTLGGEHNNVFFYPRTPSSLATLSRPGHNQTVSTFHSGAAGSYSPKSDLHPSWLLCAESLVTA